MFVPGSGGSYNVTVRRAALAVPKRTLLEVLLLFFDQLC